MPSIPLSPKCPTLKNCSRGYRQKASQSNGEICVLFGSGTGTVYPFENPRRRLYRGSNPGTDRGKRTRTAKAPKTERGVSLLIDIENSIKAAQSRGYEQWAKIHNLKQAAKTMNFITEHKIEQYTDLTAKIAEIQTESEQAADALKSAEKRLVDMAVLIKNVSTFQKTKPAYDAYRKARNKDSYRAAHEREIILHEAAAKALKAAGVSKLPTSPRCNRNMKSSRNRKKPFTPTMAD